MSHWFLLPISRFNKIIYLLVLGTIIFDITNLKNLPQQRNCIEFALKAKPIRRYIPKNRFQYKIWWFVTSQPFEYAIFVLIMLNTISLAMKFQGEPEPYTYALDILNLIFTGVFALEFVFKIMAFRFKVSYYMSFFVLLDFC